MVGVKLPQKPGSIGSSGRGRRRLMAERIERQTGHPMSVFTRALGDIA